MADNDHENRSALCVDCDGTIIKTDLLFESFFALLKQSPYIVLLLPFWLLRGKAFFKQRIAERVDLDVTLLPYHIHFLNFLREEKVLCGTMFLLAGASM